MSQHDDDQRDPLEMLAAEFIERQRRGEHPAIADYVARNPELATEIEEFFPAIAAIERVKTHRAASESGRATLGSVRLERLGDFRILREIGRGGMGIVYEAYQESLGRRVAVKVLPRQTLLDPRHLQRFEREARTAARLHHTNIVPLFGVGEQEGYHYIVMQLIHGVGLDTVLGVVRQIRSSRPVWRNGDGDGPIAPDVRRLGEAARLAEALVDGRLWPTGESAIEVSRGVPIELPGADAADTTSDPPAHAVGWVSDPTPSSEERLVQGPDLAEERSGRRPNLRGGATEDFGAGHETVVHRKSESAPAAKPPATARSHENTLGASYWRSVAFIGMQAADALHYAHAHHTLHRDIKPGNLLLDGQGVVWITDFGLAKTMDEDHVSQTGALAGTLRYMAPEQFSGRTDARSDVYSLGLTLYEFVTLQPAFADTNRSSLIHKVTHQRPKRPREIERGIPRDLETVVLKAIAADPADRYQTAGELARDLQRFLEDRPIIARRASVAERLWRWARRNPAVASLASSTFLLLVLVAVVASVAYVRTTRANVEEARQRKKAEDISALALEALDNIFQQFTPDRTASASSVEVVSEAGEEITVPIQPVLSKEAAALLEHMLNFYDRLADQSGGDVRLQKKVAEANRRVGDIRQRLGDYAESKAAYQRAIELYQQLSAAAPDDPSLRAEIARVHNELGSVQRAMNDFDDAKKSHQAALAVLEAAPPALAMQPPYRYELARTYLFLSRGGGMRGGPPMGMRDRGPEPRGPRPDGDRPDGDRSDEPRGGPPPMNPEGHRPPGPPPDILPPAPPIASEGPAPGPPEREDRGSRRGDRDRGPGGPRERDGGRSFWAERMAYLEKAVGLLEKLVAEYPDAPEYRYLLARCYRETGPGWFGRDAEASEGGLPKAVTMLQELVAQHPDVPDYRYELSITYAALSPRRPFWREDLDEEEAKRSREMLEKALAISEALVAEHPNIPDYASSLVWINLGLAGALRESDPARAEACFRKALDLQSALAARFPVNSSTRFSLAMIHSGHARFLEDRQRLPEARQAMQSSIDLLAAMAEADPGAPHLRGILSYHYRLLAGILDQTGDGEGASEANYRADLMRPGR